MPDAPDLDRKIALLLNGRRLEKETLQAPFKTQRDVAEKLQLDPADLTRCMKEQRIPTSRIPGFLGFFELTVPEWGRKTESDMTEEETAWIKLAQEPYAAFCARVRLAGGDDFSGEAGKTWRSFVDSLGKTRLPPANSKAFEIVARSREEWRQPPPGPGAVRMLPPGARDPAKIRPAHLPLVHAGDLARIFLDTRVALPKRNVEADGAYVFLFQDVVISRRRHILPLVPYPSGSSVIMPSEKLKGGRDGDPVLQVPLPGGKEGFMEIPSGWGVRRSIFAVVTDRMLDEEILCESRTQEQLQIERLDLLAARFADEALWPQGSYAVWELEYAVEEGHGDNGRRY